MASTQYQIYLTSVLNLSKTMVIKSAAVADAINNALLFNYANGQGSQYAVDTSNPTAWKYYLNLSGQYHPSDVPMSVISQDTLQTINFTVTNLGDHTATSAAYQPGTRYYADLVANYPTQEMLIRGILNPVDPITAIGAEDGTVLWYDNALVESNEMSLIQEISEWVGLYQRRWYNAAYADIADLYLAAHLSVMYAHLPNVILGLRLKYCHSHQVHTFHIREYLAGQGGLDIFVDYLTKGQQLWLYRNVRYLQRNAGQQSTFDVLVANILTPRGIPLSDWTMRQNSATQQTNLIPVVEFVRGEINSSNNNTGAQVRNVLQMLTAESNVAKGNQDLSVQTVGEVNDVLVYSTSDHLQTKVLESSMLDLTDASAYRLADCLINHWLYFSSINQYSAIVSVDNPSTGEIYTLTASEAFVIYAYTLSMSLNLPITTIPKFFANKVRKLVTPTRSEVRALVDMTVVENEDIEAVFLNLPPMARSYLSIESFNQMVQAIHSNESYQHALFSTQGHKWMRAYLEQATLFLYTDIECDLWAGQDYVSWFKQRGLNIPTMSVQDMGTVAQKILITATGQNLATTANLGDLQSAMLRLMARLSSYSVQYLASINTSPIVVLERPSIRLGSIDGSGTMEDKVVVPLSELFDSNNGGATLVQNLHPADVSLNDFEVSTKTNDKMDLTVRVADTNTTAMLERTKIPLVGLSDFTDNLDVSQADGQIGTVANYQPIGLKSLPEAFSSLTFSFYAPLSTADKTTLESRYTTYLAYNGTPVPPA